METPLELAVRKDATALLDQALIASQIQEWVEGRISPIGLHRHIQAAVSAAVDKNAPKPNPTFAPRDNTPAGWAIGVGLFLIVGGIVTLSQGAGGGLALLAIIVGLFLAVRGSKNWTSEATYQQRNANATRLLVASWRQQKGDAATAACEWHYAQLHVVLGRRIGVPERLVSEFAKESLAHVEDTRQEWRVLWWVSQPAFPPAPGPQAQRLGHEAYEEYCARWLHSIGWEDASVTRYSQDGGVDVVTSAHVVQCKHYDGGYIGVPVVREIFGVATAEGKQAAVITSGRFTTQAKDFAGKAGVALIHLDELVGEPRAHSRAGRELLSGPEEP